MINHLLATIFWRIDVWILRPIAGAAAVGLYSIGLKYLDGLNIIPSVFDHGDLPADEPLCAQRIEQPAALVRDQPAPADDGQPADRRGGHLSGAAAGLYRGRRCSI